jgi:hypothetical protein
MQSSLAKQHCKCSDCTEDASGLAGVATLQRPGTASVCDGVTDVHLMQKRESFAERAPLHGASPPQQESCLTYGGGLGFRRKLTLAKAVALEQAHPVCEGIFVESDSMITSGLEHGHVQQQGQVASARAVPLVSRTRIFKKKLAAAKDFADASLCTETLLKLDADGAQLSARAEQRETQRMGDEIADRSQQQRDKQHTPSRPARAAISTDGGIARYRELYTSNSMGDKCSGQQHGLFAVPGSFLKLPHLQLELQQQQQQNAVVMHKARCLPILPADSAIKRAAIGDLGGALKMADDLMLDDMGNLSTAAGFMSDDIADVKAVISTAEYSVNSTTTDVSTEQITTDGILTDGDSDDGTVLTVYADEQLTFSTATQCADDYTMISDNSTDDLLNRCSMPYLQCHYDDYYAAVDHEHDYAMSLVIPYGCGAYSNQFFGVTDFYKVFDTGQHALSLIQVA